MLERGRLAFQIVLLLLALFFMSYFLYDVRVSITGFAVGNPALDGFIEVGLDQLNHSTIDPEVVEALKTNMSVDVIITARSGKLPNQAVFRGKNVESFSNGRSYAARFDRNEIQQLAQDPSVEYIEPERYFDIALNDSVAITHAQTAWSRQVGTVNLTGAAQTVCIVDTGINFSHPDLASKNIAGCTVYCTTSPCKLNCSEGDFNGHGTHVAGIVAATGGIKGIAPGPNLIGVKVFSGSAGTGATSAALVRGIDWCNAHAKTYNISVITLSVASATLFPNACDSFFASFQVSVNNATSFNISVTAATGNRGSNTSIGAPACIDNVTAVSSSDKDDTYAGYANYAASLSYLLAPGTTINSTCIGGGYCIQSGTSMSTPMVAGGLSILNQLLVLTNRTRTPRQLELILNSTGTPIYHQGANKTFSRIDIDKAILSLDFLSPTVQLLSPTDGTATLNDTYSFSCSARDWQLASLSFTLSNAENGQTILSNTTLISGEFNQSIFNVGALPSAVYLWSCTARDLLNNTFTSNNFTFKVGSLTVDLLSPFNGSSMNASPLTFSCRSSVDTSGSVGKNQLFVWNTSSLFFNEVITPPQNQTTYIFNYSIILSDGPYFWNCLGSSSDDEQMFAPANYSFLYDSHAPLLDILGPPSEINSSVDVTIPFSFAVSDYLSGMCGLYVGTNVVNQLMFSAPGGSFNLTHTFNAPGAYDWYISCSDLFGNTNVSETRSIDIDSSGSTGGSGGGGGGGGGSGGGGSKPSTNTTPQQPSQPSNSQGGAVPNASAGSGESPAENVSGGVSTGRAVSGFTNGKLSWLLLIVVALIALYLTYRYLRTHYTRTHTRTAPQRSYIPLSIS